MKKRISNLLFIALLLSFSGKLSAQDMRTYQGHWKAVPSHQFFFDPQLSISNFNEKEGLLTFSSSTGQKISKPFVLDAKQSFVVLIDSTLMIKGHWNKAKNYISTFIQSGQWQYHVDLNKEGQKFIGTWRMLLASQLNAPLYLSIEEVEGEAYAAYAFLADPRFPGFACYDFRKVGNRIDFRDFRTGMHFKGTLLTTKIQLDVFAGPLKLGQLIFKAVPESERFDAEIKPTVFSQRPPSYQHDGLIIGNVMQAGIQTSLLKQMVDSINANKITKTHSILIARHDKLVYEQYFNGYDQNTPHDLRSASKSLSSALIGIAIAKGVLKDTAQKLFELLPAHKKLFEDNALKKQISVGNLLTMSAGLDAIDFGINRKSAAAEDVYQTTPDWLTTVLQASMINKPGSHANYSSANPFLLGVALKSQLKEPMEEFIDQKLFAPLQISNYLLQNDNTGQPYFGGGWLLRSRDLLKFGLLYANDGKWKGKQIISKNWVNASFKKYLILENHPEKNPYGLLWWHHQYKVGNKTIHSVEARGAGGQYIFIVKELDLVVVITSGNYRNGRVWQPEKIMENYILPAIVN